MPPVSDKRSRPVYLNLLRIRLPVAGVVSILHRVSGVVLVLVLPPLFYLLQRSLANEAGFREVEAWFDGFAVRLALIVLLWLTVEHFLSGVRHLLLDVDIGISRRAAARSARLVLALSVLVTAWLAS